MPPSITMFWPVTNAPAGEASHTTAPATSVAHRQAATLADKDRRADGVSEAAQGGADRRLGQVEPIRRGGGAAGLGDDEKDAKEVEVEIPGISLVHERYLYYLFGLWARIR